MSFEVKVNLKNPFSGVCGKECPFCTFDWGDDRYHCALLRKKEDTEMINICAEEKELYDKCPVRQEERKVNVS